MKLILMKRVTSTLAIITAMTAVVLDLQIYFGYDGQGQMYTAEKIAAAAPVFAVPAALFVICALVTAVMAVRETRGADFVADKELYEKGIYTRMAEKRNTGKTNRTRLILLAVAIVFIVFGIFNGGMRDVLVKAINICTECIGLG